MNASKECTLSRKFYKSELLAISQAPPTRSSSSLPVFSSTCVLPFGYHLSCYPQQAEQSQCRVKPSELWSKKPLFTRQSPNSRYFVVAAWNWLRNYQKRSEWKENEQVVFLALASMLYGHNSFAWQHPLGSLPWATSTPSNYSDSKTH